MEPLNGEVMKMLLLLPASNIKLLLLQVGRMLNSDKHAQQRCDKLYGKSALFFPSPTDKGAKAPDD
jgi:hypothetical protein